MTFDPLDAYISGSSSNCCGSPVMEGGICSDCHEHCEDEAVEGPSDAKLERLQGQAHRLVERREIQADQDERDMKDAGRIV